MAKKKDNSIYRNINYKYFIQGMLWGFLPIIFLLLSGYFLLLQFLDILSPLYSGNIRPEHTNIIVGGKSLGNGAIIGVLLFYLLTLASTLLIIRKRYSAFMSVLFLLLTTFLLIVLVSVLSGLLDFILLRVSLMRVCQMKTGVTPSLEALCEQGKNLFQ